MLTLNRQSLTWLDHCQRPSPRALFAPLAGPEAAEVYSDQVVPDLTALCRALVRNVCTVTVLGKHISCKESDTSDNSTGSSPDATWPKLASFSRALLVYIDHFTGGSPDIAWEH